MIKLEIKGNKFGSLQGDLTHKDIETIKELFNLNTLELKKNVEVQNNFLLTYTLKNKPSQAIKIIKK